MTQILDDPALRTPAMMYLFHRVEERLDGEPTMIVVDEGWKALDDDVFVAPDQGLGKDHPQAQRHRRLRHPERPGRARKPHRLARSSSRPRPRSSWPIPRPRRRDYMRRLRPDRARIRPDPDAAGHVALLPDQARHRQRRGAAQPLRRARSADRPVGPRAHRAPARHLARRRRRRTPPTGCRDCWSAPDGLFVRRSDS